MSSYPGRNMKQEFDALTFGRVLRCQAFCSLVSGPFLGVHFLSSPSFGCKSRKSYLFVLPAYCLGYRLWPAFFFLRGVYCLKKNLKNSD